MSKQYPGGLITKTPVTPSGPYETSTASGVWTINQAAYWAKQGLWPTSGNIAPDPYFNYVTMLLHGDGTNGAQNNTFLDSSTNNFTITRNGNTTQGTFTPYGSNWSCYLDGSGDQLTTPSQASFRIDQGNWTWEGWVFPTSLRDTNVLISLGTGGSAVWYTVSVGLTNGAIQMGTNNGTWNFIGIYASSANVIKANQWNHFALVYSGTTLYFFANGVAVGSQASPYLAPGQSGTLYMGSYYNNYNNDGSWYGGYVSNLRFVKGTAVYSGSTYTVPTAPLTAITNTSLLAFQSNRFIDTSANAYTLTRVGDTSVQRFSPFSPTTAYSTSVIGGSGYFDGSGDYLSAAANTAFVFGTGDFTIEAWFYAKLWPTDAYVVSNLSTGDTSWSIEIYGGNIRFSGWTTVWMSATQPSAGAWHHVAVSRSGTTLSMFVDGTRVATTTNSTNFSANNTLVVGDYTPAGGANFNGYISNVRLVKGTAVYSPSSSTLTIPTSPLTAISGTSFLTNFTNAGILDNAMMNDLETVGNAQISTSVKKYGTGSMYFDGTADYLKAANTLISNFGSGAFTVEAWVYFNSVSGTQVIAGNYQSSTVGWSFGKSGSTGYFYASFSGDGNDINGTTTVAINTWYHVAISGTPGATGLKLFINGVQEGSTYTGAVSLDATTPLYISDLSGLGYGINGYIDDLRITKAARYTTTFTPPTSAFPNQ